MKKVRILILAGFALIAVFTLVSTQFKKNPETSGQSTDTAAEYAVHTQFNDLPVKGMVTLIDLGATECIPCKMMAPILEKLAAAYRDRAVIAFIDVWKHRDQAPRFGVRAIPTQIFFDPDGKEVYRHQGFMSEAAIVEQLTRMGVEEPAL
ncbi:MAG TPA: thioredoxin domain-containing protein [Desulfotignum sp.]|jgi:thioredoxin 1|nr:thioredoxin domain-containing protein [Desulfotignum sp.]